jgi:hypothetical protein
MNIKGSNHFIKTIKRILGNTPDTEIKKKSEEIIFTL